MIRRVLAEMEKGTTTVRELGRRLGMDESALGRLLQFMARKGLVRDLRRQCLPERCRGCPYLSQCHATPVAGYAPVRRR